MLVRPLTIVTYLQNYCTAECRLLYTESIPYMYGFEYVFFTERKANCCRLEYFGLLNDSPQVTDWRTTVQKNIHKF